MTTRVILLTTFTGETLERLKRIYASKASEILVASDRESLLNADVTPATTLISFGSGVLVPAGFLERLAKTAYNLHAASPDFPGRDPHHHAIYRKAERYGATLHVMTHQVDSGPIVAVKMFPVPVDANPTALLCQANEAGFGLLEALGTRLLDASPLPPVPGACWGGTKTRRSDLHDLCELPLTIDAVEFERRFKAFDGGVYDNLTTMLHGWRFRIDKQAGRRGEGQNDWSEFTEDGFRALLRSLKAGGYRFARYGEPAAGRHVLWRHDVDFSMHRAARLAEIETEEGALATYFLNPRSDFYNLLEPSIEALTRRMLALGHEIGLHFDGAAYGATEWREDELIEAIARERKLLEAVIEQPIRSVSWHNPDRSNLLRFDQDEIGELINAYARTLRDGYAYASDSNGYWRFSPMGEVIAAGHERLHLLTHPGWWTPEPAPPSQRIDRCIMGRARATRRAYDMGLASGQRRNLNS